MFLTVILVWIGLSVLASVIVLAAVIRAGQVDQMQNEAPEGKTSNHIKPSSAPRETASRQPGHPAAGHNPAPTTSWGAAVRATHFSTDLPTENE